MISAFQVFFEGWLLLFLGLCLFGFVALIIGAIWLYGDAQRRRMDATLWLIILILATLFGGGIIGFVIVFIIYLVVRESHPVGGPMPAGYGPVQAPIAPAACPVCGRPMTWVPQYQRWYCASCQQYR